MSKSFRIFLYYSPSVSEKSNSHRIENRGIRKDEFSGASQNFDTFSTIKLDVRNVTAMRQPVKYTPFADSSRKKRIHNHWFIKLPSRNWPDKEPRKSAHLDKLLARISILGGWATQKRENSDDYKFRSVTQQTPQLPDCLNAWWRKTKGGNWSFIIRINN